MITQAAQTLADIIGNLTYGETRLSASVMLCPDVDLVGISSRRIYVTPDEFRRTVTNRAQDEYGLVLDVSVLEPARDISASIALVEFLADKLMRTPVGDMLCTGVEYAPIYDADLARSRRVFLSVIKVTLKEVA